MSARAAEEMLAGIYEALGDREPNEQLQKKIDELEKQARQTDWSTRCRCGAWESGHDCMCNEGD
jgi:hypothetical protein